MTDMIRPISKDSHRATGTDIFLWLDDGDRTYCTGYHQTTSNPEQHSRHTGNGSYRYTLKIVLIPAAILPVFVWFIFF